MPVNIESDIPTDHPDRIAVESAIREGLDGVGGSWRAGIMQVQGAPWWVVYVHEVQKGFKRSALLDSPPKQRPDSVREIVEQLAQERRRALRLRPDRSEPA